MMRLKLLGRSGLRVSELALGTMTFGEDWGWGASKETSRAIFDAYTAAGGNFIDTSINYTNGTAEKFVGEFIASQRDYFVVATKYTLNTRREDVNAGGNHRKNMQRSIEASLKHLKTDYIDLYYLHVWDGTTPVDEIMRGLDDLIRAGKVLYAGISDSPAWIVAQANTLADAKGCALGLAVQPWGLLEAGELTGKYNEPSTEPKRNRQANPANLELVTTLRAVAAEAGRTASQVAINWVRQQQADHHAPVIPILGARTVAQVADNLGCLDFTLSPEQMQRLSAASPIALGFPRSFTESPNIRNLIFGDNFSRLDNHRA